MGYKDHTVALYTAQTEVVLGLIRRDGTVRNREEFVRRKYQESARVFLSAYTWLAGEMNRIVPRPQGAELPYWAFRDLYSLETSGNLRVLKLEVPASQVLLFDLYDWNQVLQMKYLPASEEEGRAFRRELALRGLRETDVMMGSFYPDLKRQIQESWKRLLRHHEALLAGDDTGTGGVQAALWEIRREWVVSGLN